jgi:DNA topoisomerase IB
LISAGWYPAEIPKEAGSWKTNEETEMNEDYKDYLEYKSESLACGYEVESYAEWRGEESARDKAEEIWEARYERDELDLY